MINFKNDDNRAEGMLFLCKLLHGREPLAVGDGKYERLNVDLFEALSKFKSKLDNNLILLEDICTRSELTGVIIVLLDFLKQVMEKDEKWGLGDGGFAVANDVYSMHINLLSSVMEKEQADQFIMDPKYVKQKRIHVCEEFNELINARSQVQELDAIIDLIFVLVGYALSSKYNVNRAWRQVLGANLNKTVDLKSDKLFVKPSDWRAPYLKDCLDWSLSESKEK